MQKFSFPLFFHFLFYCYDGLNFVCWFFFKIVSPTFIKLEIIDTVHCYDNMTSERLASNQLPYAAKHFSSMINIFLQYNSRTRH